MHSDAFPTKNPPHADSDNLGRLHGAQCCRYLLALGIIGVVCGVIGIAFTGILYAVEHLSFGFTTGTFAEAVSEVPARHRFTAVALAGVAVAALWYLLRRYGPAIPSPTEVYAGKRISSLWMAADTSLQVVNVAAGASIGREGAPRQFGALAAARLAALLQLDAGHCRLLIACGTGAGLAAIYNVPIGGALFALEVILGLHVLKNGTRAVITILLSTLAVSWLATFVARLTIPDRPTYTVDWQSIDTPLLLVALFCGLLAGACGRGFAVLMDRVRATAPQGKSILWTMPLCYLLLASLAIPLPLVLGNGHALAQNLFAQNVPLTTAAILIFAKPLATLLTVKAGATGGRLTPSLSTGAAMGLLLAGICSHLWPMPMTTVAILGAAAFLAGAMRAPLSAGVLAIEFTGTGVALWPPVALTIAATWLVSLGLARVNLAKK